MIAFVVRSSDREHGGNVIEGIYSSEEKAWEKIAELNKQEPYWRIYFCDEYNLETGEKIGEKTETRSVGAST